ncbi:hypothetical protein LEP1GSC047_3751 [Leptospira inadai serovar Lyme str. 10]|uniref:Uncharacterized protein n=1 Tax=Leptospira inadai serovar Lyme str. 10 TaxID=1049790 RepID=V6HDM6_9LEPT|nr:hypothetical protein LEP1GSC047_3751 [Leptospira inadai serovar Lyme str. 10]
MVNATWLLRFFLILGGPLHFVPGHAAPGFAFATVSAASFF